MGVVCSMISYTGQHRTLLAPSVWLHSGIPACLPTCLDILRGLEKVLDKRGGPIMSLW